MKRYANGMIANNLTREDAELVLMNCSVENWMADRMFNYFGAYCRATESTDRFVKESEKYVELVKEGKIEEAQGIINDYMNYVLTFNQSIDDRAAFDYAAYEARKAEAAAKANLITDRQKSYLEYLLKNAGRNDDISNLTKAEASALIDELKK